MTERAEEARNIWRDKKIASTLESWAEFSNQESNKVLHPRAKAVRIRIGKINMKKTAWLDSGKLEDVKAEMDTAPEIEVDRQHVMQNMLSYLEELEQRYGV